MERKQTERQLKALNETLEQRVAERTATATRRAAQLQALAAELTQTEHRERRRLAQILHDHLQQLLYAARLNLETLRRSESIDAAAQEAVERVDSLLAECIAESRSLTVELCPPVLHEAGLAAAIEWLARHMEQTCNLSVETELDPRAEPESEEMRILLFGAVRELLFNVVKHAATRSARVAMRALADDVVRVTVSDQGAGCPSAAAILDNETTSGFGLFSIRERLELMGGRLEIETAPGRGTGVSIWAPRRQADGKSRHRRATGLRAMPASP